jgi:hypothetical protein
MYAQFKTKPQFSGLAPEQGYIVKDIARRARKNRKRNQTTTERI